MSYKVWFTILSLSYALDTLPQQGTIIIGAIANDGIIIAADSRAGIAGNNKEILAYIDSLPKLTLLINRYPIAFAGKGNLLDKFYINIVKDFNKTEPKNKDVQSCFIDFREYLLNISPRIENTFIGGAYYDSAPWLFSFSDSIKTASQDMFYFNEPELTPYLKKYTDSNISCKKLAIILDSVIHKYAMDAHKEAMIGGPVSIIKISEGNKIEWMQNNLVHKQPKDYATLLSMIKTKKIKTIPVVKDGVRKAIEAMESKSKSLNVLSPP